MIGRFASLGGRGGGAVENVSDIGSKSLIQKTMSMLRQGNVSHLSGAKVDEALARISAATTQMAEQGMFLDLTKQKDTMNTLMHLGDAEKGKSLGGVNVFGGMHGVRAGLKLSQSGARAASDFRSQFAGIGTAAIQASAFANAKNPLDALRNMEEMAQDPTAVHQAITDIMGNNMVSGLAFAGQGFSADQSRILAGWDGTTTPYNNTGYGAPDSGNFRRSGLMAKHEREEMVLEEANNFKSMLNAMHQIRKTLIGVGTKADTYLQTVDSLLQLVLGGGSFPRP